MNEGLIPIADKQNNIDWNAIRAEYIAGACSYRKLAEKYGISKNIIAKRSEAEGWMKDRATVRDKAAKKIVQKTADIIADNASIAAELKKKFLLRLKRIEEKYLLDATEVRTKVGNSTAIFRIRDLTAAYKDLTADMMPSELNAADNTGTENSLIAAIKLAANNAELFVDNPENADEEGQDEQ